MAEALVGMDQVYAVQHATDGSGIQASGI